MSGWDPVPDETPIDPSGLIPKHIVTRADLSVAEAKNVHKAAVKYLAARPTSRRAPFNLQWVYKLHREMFGEVWAWAGTRRTGSLNLGVEHYLIDTSLQQMLDDLVYWRDHAGMPVIEQAARLHHTAVHIHPFLNGNGRWSRMLANIWLKQMRAPLTMWPDQLLGVASVIRAEYIDCIKAADHNDLAPLIAMHLRYTEKA